VFVVRHIKNDRVRNYHHNLSRSTIYFENLTVGSASQGIPCILWNPKVHHRVNNSPQPVPILSFNLFHNLTTYSFKIHFNIIHLGRAMAQAVSLRPLSTAARVRAQVNAVGFVVDKVALGQVFLQVLRFSLSLLIRYTF
jgi:hypothetical protein